MYAEWGTGNREVSTLRPEIILALQEGWSVRAIYRELKTSNKLTISERSFYSFVAPIRDQLAGSSSVTSLHTSPNSVTESDVPNLASAHSSTNNDDFIDASASVVPLARKSGAGGFKLNPDFNLEE